MSSSLWSVAWETVTPPTSTGSSCAQGLSAPVRPTRTWILEELRLRRHRRPLERARPARAAVERAEPLLLVERVDLDRRSRRSRSRARCACAPTRRTRARRPRATRGASRADSCGSRARAATRGLAHCESSGDAVGTADAVDPDREVALCGDLRVELAQRPGGGVARVRGGLLALRGEPLVQPVEGRDAGSRPRRAPRASPECRSPSGARMRERDRLDRPQVRRHVLAALPVAARRAAHEARRPRTRARPRSRRSSARSRRRPARPSRAACARRRPTSSSASSVVTFSSDPIGVRCSTLRNLSDGRRAHALASASRVRRAPDAPPRVALSSSKSRS